MTHSQLLACPSVPLGRDQITSFDQQSWGLERKIASLFTVTRYVTIQLTVDHLVWNVSASLLSKTVMTFQFIEYLNIQKYSLKKARLVAQKQGTSILVGRRCMWKKVQRNALGRTFMMPRSHNNANKQQQHFDVNTRRLFGLSHIARFLL